MKEQIKKIVLSLFPELASGNHLSKRAKVLRSNDLPSQAETASDFRPRYACDLLVLDSQGKPTKQELFDVPIPFTGLYSLPQPDDIVRIEFDYGNSNMPVITGVLTTSQTIPPLQSDEILIFNNEQNRIILKNGQLVIESKQIDELSQNKTQTAVHLTESYKESEKTVSGSDSEEVGGIKSIEAGSFAITSTAGVNIGAVSNAQVASAMELALLGGKKIALGSLELEIKTPLTEISISKLGAVEVKNKLGEMIISELGNVDVKNKLGEMTISKTGDIEVKNKIGTFGIDKTGKFEMKNTTQGDLKAILDHILKALASAVITVGTPINPQEINQAQTKLLALFK